MENVTFEDLTPFTKYTFQVAATTKAGTGPESENVIVMTDEAEPTVPLGVFIQNADDSSITLVWAEPDSPNGIIVGYNLRYWRQPTGSKTTLTNLRQTTHRLTNLPMNVDYYLQVQAETSAGPGPWSQAVSAETRIGVPGHVRNLRVTTRTDKSIHLAWEATLSPNGRLTHYNVEYRVLARPYRADFSAQNEYIKFEVLSAAYEKNDFEPGTEYEFKISAQNQLYGGLVSTLTVYTMPLSDIDIPMPLVPELVPEEITDNTVSIELTRVDSIYVTSYVVRVQRISALRKREAFLPGHHRDSPDDYIAAEFTRQDTTLKFVVGDSLSYGDYYNAPLRIDSTYRISIGAVSKGNETEASVRYSDPLTVTVRKKVTGVSGGVVAAVVVVVLVCLIALALILCVLWRRRKNHHLSGNPTAPDTVELALSDQPKEVTYEIDSPSPAITSYDNDDDVNVYEDVGLPQWAVKWAVDWKNLTVGDKVLGKGNFGEVRAATLNIKGTVTKAAVKTLKGGASGTDTEDFMAEFKIISRIGKHPNIVGLLGACLHEAILYVALEFLPNGNLRDYLRKTRPKQLGVDRQSIASTLTSSELLSFAIDVATGMEHLSAIGIIHRDLAARNVLLAEDKTAKVSDFGLSRGEDLYVQKSMTRVPSRWLAIESLTKRMYKTKSDVWSFGILLWEIVTYGATPYPGIQTKSLAERLLDGYRMPKPENCAEEIYDLMLQCWQRSPSQRPDFTQIKEALTLMNDNSDEKIYLSPTVYENFLIKRELDDN